MGLPPFVYSPFTRKWTELDATDIERLREASEGWHIEYKSEIPKAEAAGKSLSSFANSYGGWLFYGVETPSGGSSLPTAFPGIADSDIARVLDMLQKGATLVRPHPFFEHKVIPGSDTSAILPAGKSIVAVRVPPGANGPYVHNNGRIYRRVADASEPTHETDRHVLDLLWERSNDARTQWRNIVTQEFTVSKGEEDHPRMHVFLSCDPFGDRGARMPSDLTRFVDLMRQTSHESGGLPFDNFFTAPYCFVARQIAANDPYNLVLTWRQRLDGTAIVSLPLSWSRLENAAGFDWLDGYKQADRFRELCQKAGLDKGRVLDLCNLAHVLTGIMHRYRHLLRESKITFDFYGCVRIDNVWRSVPFIDLPEYSEFIAAYGVPLVQLDDVRAPEAVDGLWAFKNWPVEADDRFDDGLLLFQGALFALGVRLDPNAVLDDWRGLGERTLQRAEGVTSRRR